uniref:CCHC-type domain-containing protein n=1 Tax=Lactuca sativa TaxID=4236 RepID=A0A9R1WVA0_LACSA|nr:hypothetical protein LSAT_V11C900481710 [Lactuca sativa]
MRHGTSKQSPSMRQENAMAYAISLAPIAVTTPASEGQYTGKLSKCHLCHIHHTDNFMHPNRGNIEKYCCQPTIAPTSTTNQGMATLPDNRACFECRIVGHIRRNCQKMRNEGGNARGRAFAVDTKDSIQYPTIVIGTFPVNSIYVSILFDSEYIPLPNEESLKIYEDKTNKGLRIISCMKAKNYLHNK